MSLNKKQIDYNAFKEKFQKYGDPNKNLAITAVFIIVIAVIVSIYFIKTSINTITEKHLAYYPSKVSFYFDYNLKNKNKDTLNTALLFFDYKYSKQNLNIKPKDAFGDFFSFGKWTEKINNKNCEIKLLVIPTKTTLKTNAALKNLFDKNERFYSRVYKGYKITYFSKKRWVFLVNRGNLYISNNVFALKHIIDNKIIKKNKGLLSLEKTSEMLKELDNSRFATIIFNNSNNVLNHKEKDILVNHFYLNYKEFLKNNYPVIITIKERQNGIIIKSIDSVYLDNKLIKKKSVNTN